MISTLVFLCHDLLGLTITQTTKTIFPHIPMTFLHLSYRSDTTVEAFEKASDSLLSKIQPKETCVILTDLFGSTPATSLTRKGRNITFP